MEDSPITKVHALAQAAETYQERGQLTEAIAAHTKTIEQIKIALDMSIDPQAMSALVSMEKQHEKAIKALQRQVQQRTSGAASGAGGGIGNSGTGSGRTAAHAKSLQRSHGARPSYASLSRHQLHNSLSSLNVIPPRHSSRNNYGSGSAAASLHGSSQNPSIIHPSKSAYRPSRRSAGTGNLFTQANSDLLTMGTSSASSIMAGAYRGRAEFGDQRHHGFWQDQCADSMRTDCSFTLDSEKSASYSIVDGLGISSGTFSLGTASGPGDRISHESNQGLPYTEESQRYSSLSQPSAYTTLGGPNHVMDDSEVHWSNTTGVVSKADVLDQLINGTDQDDEFAEEDAVDDDDLDLMDDSFCFINPPGMTKCSHDTNHASTHQSHQDGLSNPGPLKAHPRLEAKPQPRKTSEELMIENAELRRLVDTMSAQLQASIKNRERMQQRLQQAHSIEQMATSLQQRVNQLELELLTMRAKHEKQQAKIARHQEQRQQAKIIIHQLQAQIQLLQKQQRQSLTTSHPSNLPPKDGCVSDVDKVLLKLNETLHLDSTTASPLPSQPSSPLIELPSSTADTNTASTNAESSGTLATSMASTITTTRTISTEPQADISKSDLKPSDALPNLDVSTVEEKTTQIIPVSAAAGSAIGV